eukprot:6222071-Prymnesium_polylepis.1
MANASGTYTTLDVPMQCTSPFLAASLPGLPASSTLHVMWDPPFDNGDAITHYNLTMDGRSTLLATRSHTPQYSLVGLLPYSSHTFAVAALN